MIRQVEDRAVLETRRAMWPDNEEPRGVARFRGAQRNAFRRQIEIEEIYAHDEIAAREPAIISSRRRQPGKTAPGAANFAIMRLDVSATVAETILSGSRTGSPRLILSTFSMPAVTFPQTVYCLSRKRASPKQMKNCELAEFGRPARAPWSRCRAHAARQ